MNKNCQFKIRKLSSSDIFLNRIPTKKRRINLLINDNTEEAQPMKTILSTSNVKINENAQHKNKNISQENDSLKAKQKPLRVIKNKNIYRNKNTKENFRQNSFTETTEPKHQNRKILSKNNYFLMKQCIPDSSSSSWFPTTDRLNFQNLSKIPPKFDSLKAENNRRDVTLQQSEIVLKTAKQIVIKKDNQLDALNRITDITSTNSTGGNQGSTLYSEYTDDIIEYLFTCETSMTKIYEPKEYTIKSRKSLINYLIQVQEYFNSDCTTFFAAVQIFDYYTKMMSVNCTKLQVTILAAFWIASKYSDSIVPLTGSEILDIAEGMYQLSDLKISERDILLRLNFSVNFSEPLTFSRCYLYHLKFPNSPMLAHCVNYMLHCFVFSDSYSKYKSSKIAAAAVRLTLLYFENMDIEVVNKLWEKLQRMSFYYDIFELVEVEEEIMIAVHSIQDPNCEYREAFKKFTKAKHFSVSERLLKIIVAT